MAQATISITVNGEAKEVEATTTGVELFAEDKNIIAVKINGENRDLYTPLNDGDTVDPIALDSEDGLAIMRHSATHVMAQAVQEVYPNAKLGVGPVIKDGFYYDFQVDQPFTPNDLKDIEKRMQRIIKSSQSFRRRLLAWFREEPDHAARLRHRMGHQGRPQGLPDPPGRSRQARSPQARRRDGPVLLPG